MPFIFPCLMTNFSNSGRENLARAYIIKFISCILSPKPYKQGKVEGGGKNCQKWAKNRGVPRKTLQRTPFFCLSAHDSGLDRKSISCMVKRRNNPLYIDNRNERKGKTGKGEVERNRGCQPRVLSVAPLETLYECPTVLHHRRTE